MHVCLLTDSREPSGVGAHMLTLAAELRGRRISLVTPAMDEDAALVRQALALGIEVFHDEEERAGGLESRLQQLSVDILHVHAGVAWEGHDAVFAGRRAGIPIVVRTEHLPQLITTNQQRSEHRAVVRLLDRLICVSDHVARSRGCPSSASSRCRPTPLRLRLRREPLGW